MTADRWAAIAESGGARALRVGGWFGRLLGRRLSVLLLWPAALYYFARNPHARRGSRQYLERLWASAEGRTALGSRPDTRMVLRHIHEFGVALYDRMMVWGGALDAMTVEHDGSDRIFEVAGSGRGALLLGAHLGSIDMLWFLSQKYDLVVNVVAFYGNAEHINSFFQSLAPDSKVRLIDIDPGSVRAAFEIRACVERGEFVVILADRVAPGKTGRVASTSFLGRPAYFPLAPFLLACVLDCPAYLTLCLRRGDARYETVLRPLSDGRHRERHERDKHAHELLERYVTLLEAFCVRHPFQWFNYYEFWDAGDA